MDFTKFDTDVRGLKTERELTEEFENLRTKLNQHADSNGSFSDDEELLSISKQLDKLHLEIVRIQQSNK